LRQPEQKGRSARFLSSSNPNQTHARGYPVYPAHNLQRQQYSMKFGLISFQLPGHLNPMTALARHLQMRNHDVVFLYSSGAAGLPFIPDEEVERVISERSAELSKQQGDEVLRFSMSQ
jgi:hypothetical protein